MKIAMFGHKHLPSRSGGVEVAAEALSTRLAAMGHDVTCYNRSGGAVLTEYKGVRLKTVPTMNRKGLAAVTSSFFAALCCAFSGADVVHIHGEGPAFLCWMLKLFGKQVVVTIHGLDWQREKWKGGFGARYIRAGEEVAVRFADKIIVLSRSAQDYFWKTYRRETVWIPNGVNGPKIAAVEEICRLYGLEKDSYILFLGRLVPEKGIHYLIEAFRGVKTEKKLVIAGAQSDTAAYAATLRAMAEEDSRVIFTGFVQGRLLEELYSSAYVYVLPSDLEGMPLGLLEAMSYGNCCLVSDIAECTEVVEDKAVVFPKGDIAALKDRLQMLCDDPRQVTKYRKTAASQVCGKYSWEDVAEKTAKLYGEIGR